MQVQPAASTHTDTPNGDPIVVLHGATWADYQRVLEMRGERRSPRVAYLEGALELMSPSREHEQLKSTIGRLVEVWCAVQGIRFGAFGAWTLENKETERGVEPDECYIFGNADAKVPDLAIEVIWTSGGIDKKEIYRKLGVRELWTWRKGRFTVSALRGDQYEDVAASEALPGIDLEQLASFLDRPFTSDAITQYRAALEARRK